MKVHEVEMELGISKQTIYYYEKEGLIKVDRDENNYRNYSTTNLETLKLIKLLREMEISIDEIRLILDGHLSIREALEKKKEYLKINKQELENIDLKINNYIKRNRVKISFDHQLIKNWTIKDTLYINDNCLVYKSTTIPFTQINQIDLSMCSELYAMNIIKVYLNYYVDLDIQCNHDTYSFQIINNQEVASLFERLKNANIKINDPLNLIELYRDKDLVTLNKYLDNNFKKWAKKYHLDNPRDDGFVQKLKTTKSSF